MSDNPEDYELAHYGIKGMKWGVRRKEGPDGRVGKSQRTPEQQAKYDKLKKVSASVAIGAAVLAGAGIAIYEGTTLNATKAGVEAETELGRKIIRTKINEMPDEKISMGQNFVRRSKVEETYVNDRTYVVKGEEQPWQFLFGNNRVNLSSTREIEIPGLKTQLDIISDTYGEVDRKAFKDSYAKKGILAKRYIDNLSDNDVSAKTVSELTNTWWKGDRADDYISQLQRRGYSAVQDPNYADMESKIVFDAKSLVIDSVQLNVEDDD